MAGHRDIDRLSSEIEDLFAELWQVPRFARSRQGFRPQVDCYRTDEPAELTIVIELPGVDVEAIEIVAVPGELAVSGTRERPRAPARHYQQMELEYGPFERRIPLADDVDVTGGTARYDRGLLTIVLPVTPAAPRPQRVAIVITGRL